MRDLTADLELCAKATPEPWVEDGAGSVYSADDKDGGDICEMCPCRSLDVTNANAVFIAEAREGWPEAIRRAIKAEELLSRVAAQLNSEKYDYSVSRDLQDEIMKHLTGF